MTITRRGLMLVLSSPSGAGKTTLSRRLLEFDTTLMMSVSVTTREKRPSEISGRDYHFVDAAEFKRLIDKGELLEHAEVFGFCYGTPKAPVEAALAAGRDILFDIDWQGGRQLRQFAANEIVSIFILPPSIAELEKRLRGRAQDNDSVVADRMTKARTEMSHWREYDYVVINRDLEQSLGQLQAILTGERLKRTRQIGLEDFVQSLIE